MGMTDKYMYSHLGTSIYKSPEMLKGDEYSSKTDIWSLGIMIYLMLFGKYPYPNLKHYDSEYH